MKDTPGDKITIRVGGDLTGVVIAGSRNTYMKQREPEPRQCEASSVQVNTAYGNSTICAVGRGEQHTHEVPEPPESATRSG
jgi:hypothetical protein